MEQRTELEVPEWFWSSHKESLEKLAANQSQSEIFLDKIWMNFQNFSQRDISQHYNDIFKNLEEEVKLLDGKSTCNFSDCQKNFFRIVRSIYALNMVASRPPTSPGLYLAYFMGMFSGDSYLLENR